MVDQDKSYEQQGTAAKQALAQPPSESISEPVGTSNQGIHSAKAETSSDEEIKKATQELDSIRRGELWIIGINSLAVVVAFAVCLVYYFQLRVMRGQLEVMRGQLTEMRSSSADTHTLATASDTQSKQAIEQTGRMKESLTKTDNLIKATSELAEETGRSANIAHDSLENAKRSLELSERSIEIQERPWVGITTMSVDIAPLEDGKPMTGNIAFINSGKGPAFDVELTSLCNYDRQPTIDMSSIVAVVASKGVLMPGVIKGTLDWNCTLPLTPAQYSLVKQGLKKIYVFGSITYKDAIGSKEHFHVTHFCGFWLKAANAFSDCPGYNSAD